MTTRELPGERYDARGRRTGTPLVSLWRPTTRDGTPTVSTVLIQVGERTTVHVDAAALRAAILDLVPATEETP